MSVTARDLLSIPLPESLTSTIMCRTGLNVLLVSNRTYWIQSNLVHTGPTELLGTMCEFHVRISLFKYGLKIRMT